MKLQGQLATQLARISCASPFDRHALARAVKAEESCLGVVRNGKCGRGTAGKIAVFWLLERNGKIYTAISADRKLESTIDRDRKF